MGNWVDLANPENVASPSRIPDVSDRPCRFFHEYYRQENCRSKAACRARTSRLQESARFLARELALRETKKHPRSGSRKSFDRSRGHRLVARYFDLRVARSPLAA